jgi:hypothetical protein
LPRCGIVVSSTWRLNSPSFEDLISSLTSFGISRESILGMTPDLSSLGCTYPPDCSHNTRTDEILLWLYVNTFWKESTSKQLLSPLEGDESSLNSFEEDVWVHSFTYDKGLVSRSNWVLNERIHVSNFIAIDDMRLDLKSCFRHTADIRNHFLLTRVKDGLTQDCVDNGLNLFSLSFYYSDWAKEVFDICRNPNCLHLIKGNHEITNINKINQNDENVQVDISQEETNVIKKRVKKERTHNCMIH